MRACVLVSERVVERVSGVCALGYGRVARADHARVSGPATGPVPRVSVLPVYYGPPPRGGGRRVGVVGWFFGRS